MAGHFDAKADSWKTDSHCNSDQGKEDKWRETWRYRDTVSSAMNKAIDAWLSCKGGAPSPQSGPHAELRFFPVLGKPDGINLQVRWPATGGPFTHVPKLELQSRGLTCDGFTCEPKTGVCSKRVSAANLQDGGAKYICVRKRERFEKLLCEGLAKRCDPHGTPFGGFDEVRITGTAEDQGVEVDIDPLRIPETDLQCACPGDRFPTDTDTDTKNCGACGRACTVNADVAPAGLCVAGRCESYSIAVSGKEILENQEATFTVHHLPPGKVALSFKGTSTKLKRRYPAFQSFCDQGGVQFQIDLKSSGESRSMISRLNFTPKAGANCQESYPLDAELEGTADADGDLPVQVKAVHCYRNANGKADPAEGTSTGCVVTGALQVTSLVARPNVVIANASPQTVPAAAVTRCPPAAPVTPPIVDPGARPGCHCTMIESSGNGAGGASAATLVFGLAAFRRRRRWAGGIHHRSASAR